MSFYDELPKNFKPLVVLGDIDGYLHIFSNQPDETLLAILDMAIESVDQQQYDEKTTMLQ